MANEDLLEKLKSAKIEGVDRVKKRLGVQIVRGTSGRKMNPRARLFAAYYGLTYPPVFESDLDQSDFDGQEGNQVERLAKIMGLQLAPKPDRMFVPTANYHNILGLQAVRDQRRTTNGFVSILDIVPGSRNLPTFRATSLGAGSSVTALITAVLNSDVLGKQMTQAFFEQECLIVVRVSGIAGKYGSETLLTYDRRHFNTNQAANKITALWIQIPSPRFPKDNEKLTKELLANAYRVLTELSLQAMGRHICPARIGSDGISRETAYYPQAADLIFLTGADTEYMGFSCLDDYLTYDANLRCYLLGKSAGAEAFFTALQNILEDTSQPDIYSSSKNCIPLGWSSLDSGRKWARGYIASKAAEKALREGVLRGIEAEGETPNDVESEMVEKADRLLRAVGAGKAAVLGELDTLTDADGNSYLGLRRLEQRFDEVLAKVAEARGLRGRKKLRKARYLFEELVEDIETRLMPALLGNKQSPIESPGEIAKNAERLKSNKHQANERLVGRIEETADKIDIQAGRGGLPEAEQLRRGCSAVVEGWISSLEQEIKTDEADLEELRARSENWMKAIRRIKKGGRSK